MPAQRFSGSRRAAVRLVLLALPALSALQVPMPATAATAAGAGSACGPAACTKEQLARCRQANDMMLEQLRQLPATSPVDRERKAALQARVQALLADHRRNGVDACSTWNALGGIAASQ